MTGPFEPEVDTLAVGTPAAESVTGFDEAHAATAATDAGRHRSLSLIGVLLRCWRKKKSRSLEHG